MTGDVSKQNLALVSLFGSLANCLVAFGVADAILAAAVQSIGLGLASVVLYALHRNDATTPRA